MNIAVQKQGGEWPRDLGAGRTSAQGPKSPCALAVDSDSCLKFQHSLCISLYLPHGLVRAGVRVFPYLLVGRGRSSCAL